MKENRDKEKEKFFEEYKKLSQKYSFDFYPVIEYSQFGIIPKVVIVDMKDVEKVEENKNQPSE
jgi:hypothetical protein